jgi:hypothetical protein
VIAIMISVGGIVLGLGYAMDNSRLKNFGRDELVQSFINGAIVGSLFLFFSPAGLGTSIINGVVSGAHANATCSSYMSTNYAICFAYNYLVGIKPVTINNASYPSLLDSSLELLLPISGIYVTLGLISSVQLDFGVASISFANILTPVLSQEDFIITGLTFAIISIYAQSALLSVIAVVAVPLLLPVGLVLRTFYPTRKLGGTAIAIAIGLFAIFPLTYLLDAQITANYSGVINQAALSAFSIQADGFEGGMLSLGALSANAISGPLQGLMSGLSGLVSSFSGLIKELLSWLALLIVQVFFFPVLSVVLTITAVRELAKMLGSEVSFGRFDVF